jgi:hypothetical protein
MDAELRDFARQALAKGVERPRIAAVLRQAGWAEADVGAALDAFADSDFGLPVPRPKPYLSAREVFLYLVMFAALYSCAYHLGDLAFDLINRAFPDPVDRISGSRFAESVRWNVAALIVGFPVFLLTFRLITGAIARDPTKRGSRPRKWLTYLTLLVAAVALAGDLATLVYNVLGGEFTGRFALKVATVAVIAGGAFWYFLADMRKEEAEP